MNLRVSRLVLLFFSYLSLGHCDNEVDVDASVSIIPLQGGDILYPGIKALALGVGCKPANPAYPVSGSTSTSITRFVLTEPYAQFIILNVGHFHLLPRDFLKIYATPLADLDDADETFASPVLIDPTVQIIMGADVTGGDFITETFRTTSITVELHTSLFSSAAVPSLEGRGPPLNPLLSNDDACLGFEIGSYRYTAQGATHPGQSRESVCAQDDSKNAICYDHLPSVYAKSKAVTRMIIHKARGSFYCTGWLVGCEGHVMTNEHCVSSEADATKINFEFMAQGADCETNCQGGGRCAGTRQATSATLIAVDYALDYALLKPINPLVDLNAMYGYLEMRDSGPVLHERIYLPQHPSGWGMQIAMEAEGAFSTVTSLTQGGCSPNQAAYMADTRGGSSGSPVLGSSDDKVVALHHCGGCPNTGIQIHKVIADLRAKGKLPLCATGTPSLEATTAIDGTLFQSDATMTIDYIPFHVEADGKVEIDVLSYETKDYKTFTDVNDDCDASFVNTAIVLFRNSPEGDTPLVALASNDDSGPKMGRKDGSISIRDAFLSLTLEAGDYVVAVGLSSLTAADAQLRQPTLPCPGNTIYPLTCTETLTEHGNYRLTLRSVSPIRILTSHVSSYVGRQCDAPNAQEFKTCPYHHAPRSLPLRSRSSGSIYRRSDDWASIDYISFELEAPSWVELDVMSMETINFEDFTDVNDDCDASFIDATLILFKKDDDTLDAEDDLLRSLPTEKDAVVAIITGSAPDEGRTHDASMSNRDPFTRTQLAAGRYVVAIGRHPLGVNDALNERSPGALHATPHECTNLEAAHGNYQLSIRSTQVLSQLDVPDSYAGNRCASEVVSLRYPDACPYHLDENIIYNHVFDGSLVFSSVSEVAEGVNVPEKEMMVEAVAPDVEVQGASSTSVDYLYFNLQEDDPALELDILSMETTDYQTFTDVNNDCDASFINSVLILLRLDLETPEDLDTAVFVASNNDAPDRSVGRDDGSISVRDSFLQVPLDAGRYVVAVGRHPFTETEARVGTILSADSSGNRATQFTCTRVNRGTHGNYRLTLRAHVLVTALQGPTSARVGSCDLPRIDNPTLFVACPYHIPNEAGWKSNVVWDGTITRTAPRASVAPATVVSVDHIPFSITNASRVLVHVLSYEMVASALKASYETSFVDVNQDCDPSFIDSVVYVFNASTDASSALLPDDLIVTNDDDEAFTTRAMRQSVSTRDSFVAMDLDAGEYVLVIGRYPLSLEEAIAGRSMVSPTAYSPLTCGVVSDHGNYRVELMSPEVLTSTWTSSSIGNGSDSCEKDTPMCVGDQMTSMQ